MASFAPDQVPPLLPAALKAVEDRKFDSHQGVNALAILRALFVNVRAGQIEQGGWVAAERLGGDRGIEGRRAGVGVDPHAQVRGGQVLDEDPGQAGARLRYDGGVPLFLRHLATERLQKLRVAVEVRKALAEFVPEVVVTS